MVTLALSAGLSRRETLKSPLLPQSIQHSLTTQNLAVEEVVRARGSSVPRMRTAYLLPAPLGDDDIGAAGGPTRHDTRSAAWMTSWMVAKGGLPARQRPIPLDSRVLGLEARRESALSALSHTPAAGENGSGSTEAVPTWTLDLHKGPRRDCQRSVFNSASVRHD